MYIVLLWQYDKICCWIGPRWPNVIDDDVSWYLYFVSQLNILWMFENKKLFGFFPLRGFTLIFDLNLGVSIVHAFLVLLFTITLLYWCHCSPYIIANDDIMLWGEYNVKMLKKFKNAIIYNREQIYP